jgi:hypothetical protein
MFIYEIFKKKIQYFYNLNLIYYNFNPINILIDKNISIIKDFDFYWYKKEKLDFKIKIKNWTSQNFKFSKSENNKYRLLKIWDFLF